MKTKRETEENRTKILLLSEVVLPLSTESRK